VGYEKIIVVDAIFRPSRAKLAKFIDSIRDESKVSTDILSTHNVNFHFCSRIRTHIRHSQF